MKNTLFLALLLIASPAFAAWSDFLDIFTESESSNAVNVSNLADSEIIDGLKTALGNGVSSAIKNLGKLDGFYKNPRVKIPMPESLESVSKALRTIKQDKLADEFEMTMNRAAEKAVPEAASIFGNAISQMSFNDARQILEGPDDAATRYLRRTSGNKIVNRFLPIVSEATDQVGVTARFKSIMEHLGPLANWINTDAVDLDQYIADKAVDGLFLKIADEEKLIRDNPAARTSDILKKVFSKE